MMDNPLAQKLRDGQLCLNGWLMIADPFVAEVMGRTGWDSLTIDLQHGLHDYRSAVACLQAMHGQAVATLARVPWNEAGIIGKVLDAGAWGIICPMINSAADAETLVAACLYAPDGARSYGPIRAGLYGGAVKYQLSANRNILILPQIETIAAVDNIDAILSVAGISGAYVGPGDLGLTMGLPPTLDRDELEILAVYRRILDAADRHGKIAGIHNATPAYAARMAQMGFRFVTAATDISLVGAGAADAATMTRRLAADGIAR